MWLRAAERHHPTIAQELQYVVFNHYAGHTPTRYVPVQAFLVSSWFPMYLGQLSRAHTHPRKRMLSFVTGEGKVYLDGHLAGI